MAELWVFAFCAAVGFVAAGTISSFYQWVTSQQADFRIDQKSMFGIVLTVLLSMFAGPFIVARRVVSALRSHEIEALPAALGAIVAGMWSVCAGIFYLSLLISA